MKPDEVRKLVGGYGMGTLTGEERQALLQAALSDQELFNDLAREQALKDLLEDPQARRELLKALADKPAGAAAWAAWWRRPAAWALAGGLATAAVVAVIFVRTAWRPPQLAPVLVAKREAAPVVAPEAKMQQADVRERAKVQAPVKSRTKPEAVVADAPAPAPPPPEKPATLAARQEATRPGDSMRGPMARTVAAPAVVGGLYRADLAAQPAAIPYRFLRLNAAGNFAEVSLDTVFRPGEPVRVEFEPKQSGHLVVSDNASKTLLDTEMATGAPATLDVPPEVNRLAVTFTPTGEARAIPFEIQIRRQ